MLREGKIGENEYATYFWQGIPKALRNRIENRILTGDPIRDLSEPFGVNEIDLAAETLLQRNRFDRILADTDSEDEASSGEEESSESDDESSDSDSESERERRHRRSRRKKPRTRRRKSEVERSEKVETPRKRVVNAPRKEVEGLIRQMNLLTVDDPKYGLAYYRAMKLDEDVSKIVRPPIPHGMYQKPISSFPNAIYQSVP